MATLIFVDGRREEVGYNQAVSVQGVKDGAKEIQGKPVDSRQTAFAAMVEEVVFDDLPKAKAVATGRIPQADPKLRAIVSDTKIRGYKKFLAVGRYLKEK